MSAMIPQPEAYFRRLIPERLPLFKAMEAEATREGIPIVGPLVGALLALLTRATNARRVLELGTASGYSTLHLAAALETTGGELLTIELDPAMAARALVNLRQAGLSGGVEIKVADALGVLPRLAGPFDLVFMDIEKRDYALALPHCGRLMRSGGLLIVDNTAFADAGRFNQDIAAHPDWLAINLLAFLPNHSPEHDGLCLALRR